MSYWGICLPEILSNHGVDLDSDTLEAIIDDVEACASVRSEYEPPVGAGYRSQVEELKEKIRILEGRVPCQKCSGKGGAWMQITNCHTLYDTCYHCNGKGWV